MNGWNLTFSNGIGGSATALLLLLLIFDWTRATSWLKWIVAIYKAGPPT